MSIKIRLIGLAMLSLLCLLLIGGYSLLHSHRMQQALETSRLASQALRNHGIAAQAHDALRSDVLAATLASVTTSADRKDVEKELKEHLTALRKALKANEELVLPPEIAQGLQQIRPAVDSYLLDSEAVTKSAFDNPAELEVRLPKFKVSFSNLEKEMERVAVLIEKFAADAAETAHRKADGFAQILPGIVLLAVASFGVLASWAILNITGNLKTVQFAVDQLNTGSGDLHYRLPLLPGEFGGVARSLNTFLDTLGGIIVQVGRASGEIVGAAGQIATGNQDLSQRTVNQANSLAETAVAMEELIATVKQNAANAQQANQLAASASEVAGSGGAAVSQVVATMSAINTSAKKIVDIISVIDGIAFQTNILALNAAVEAARAGEQGRGFAVVANEVRGLAQRSAAAAKEIKLLIHDSVDKVDAGATLVDAARNTMDEVVNSVRQVSLIIGDITTASQQQTAGLTTINASIAAMDKATQQNTALVERSAAAAQALYQQADGLQGVIGVFRLASA